jgi:hypothetical protein
MNNKAKAELNHWLNNQSQELPPYDAFDDIMDQVHQRKRQHNIRLQAVAAAVFAGLLFWLLPQVNNDQLKNLQQLTDKIALIEHVVRNEVVHHSEPGSQVMEKMISMENWLDQLDQNIAQTDDTNQKLELLNAKLEILDDLVAIHKKYQQRTYKQII